MKPNPANFEHFEDPHGGMWIRIKTGQFKDVIWRPSDMKMADKVNEDGSAALDYTLEFLGDIPKKIDLFEKLSGEILYNIIVTQVENDKNGV